MYISRGNILRKTHICLGFLLLLLVIVSCGTGKGTGLAQDIEDYEDLQELVASREFEIENDWVFPLRGSSINLIGNSNFIRFKGDSVRIFLPYFGVRHSGGGYSGEGGIRYEGLARNLEIVEDEEDNDLLLKFEGRNKSEHYNFIIILFPNGNVHTSVNSSQRDPISYRGEIKPYQKEE